MVNPPLDNLALKFEPADLSMMLTGSARVLNDLFTRHMVDVLDGDVPSPDLSPDKSLSVLDDLVKAFSSGEGLDRIKSEVDRLTMAQEDRMTLVTSLVTQYNLVRMSRLMLARDRLELFMMAASSRGDLTPSEAILFLKMIQTDMTEIQTQLKPTTIKDAKGLVDKVDYAQRKVTVSTDYESTSPQGREIIRKLMYGLLKAVNKPGRASDSTGLGSDDKGATLE